MIITEYKTVYLRGVKTLIRYEVKITKEYKVTEVVPYLGENIKDQLTDTEFDQIVEVITHGRRVNE